MTSKPAIHAWETKVTIRIRAEGATMGEASASLAAVLATLRDNPGVVAVDMVGMLRKASR